MFAFAVYVGKLVADAAAFIPPRMYLCGEFDGLVGLPGEAKVMDNCNDVGKLGAASEATDLATAVDRTLKCLSDVCDVGELGTNEATDPATAVDRTLMRLSDLAVLPA